MNRRAKYRLSEWVFNGDIDSADGKVRIWLCPVLQPLNLLYGNKAKFEIKQAYSHPGRSKSIDTC